VGNLGDGGVCEEPRQPLPDGFLIGSVLTLSVRQRKVYAAAFGYREADPDNVALMGIQCGFLLTAVGIKRGGFYIEGDMGGVGKVGLEFSHRVNGYIRHRVNLLFNYEAVCYMDMPE
jgi:hypothetical protein